MECREYALADAVMDNTKAGAHGRLSRTSEKLLPESFRGARCPCHADTRSEIMVVPIVETGFAVHRAGQIKRNDRIDRRSDALVHIVGPQVKPVTKIHGWGNLYPIRLPRRRRQGVTQPVC